MPKKKSASSHRLPCQEEIYAGCYIDFEGFAPNEHQTSPPPVLIGIYREEEFKQVVFTQAYRWAALDSGVTHLVEFEPDRNAFLKDLVSSTRKKRPMFAYSEHELNVIKKCIGYSIAERYRNVRGIAKKCFNKSPARFPGAQSIENYSLSEVARILTIELKHKLPTGGVTERLRNVRTYSDSRRNWSSAPPDIRQQWREVLMHNREDTRCLFDILSKLKPQ